MQTLEEVRHIRINDRVKPLNLDCDVPLRVRWWPVRGADEYRVVVYADSSAKRVIWESAPAHGHRLVIYNLGMIPSNRYWMRIQAIRYRTAGGTGESSAAGQDGSDLREESVGEKSWSPIITFGTGPGIHWYADPIWADPATIAEEDTRTEGVSFEHHDTVQPGGDEQFVPPAIRQTKHNGHGWAFLHGSFELPDAKIDWATLNMTAASVVTGRQFVYRAWLNGEFVGLGPTFPTGDEARYDGFGVTRFLKPGKRQTIDIVAWTLEDQRFLAQIDVKLVDGRILHFGTGPQWTGIVGNRAYPDSRSIGTQYFEAPAEDIQSQYLPSSLPEGTAEHDWPAAVVKPRFVRLLPGQTDNVIVHYEPAVQVTRLGDDRLLFDFGRSWMGGIRLDGLADLVAAGTTADLAVRYGEVRDAVSGGAQYHLSTFNTYQDVWHVAGGADSLETWGIRVFRYVELAASTSPESMALLRHIAEHPEIVRASAILYPFDTDVKGSFHCSDETVDKVWRFCRNTIASLNGPIYVDSWTRERAAYEADAWLQWRGHLTLDDAPSLGAYTVDYLLENRTWPTEWPLCLIHAVHDIWMATGELDQARRDYDALARLLPDRYYDAESGFIVKDPVASHLPDGAPWDGDLVDWPPSERNGFEFGRVNTVINAMASHAYADMGRLASALGHYEDADRWTGQAEHMRAAIHSRLYSESLGAYVDGLDSGSHGRQLNHASLHASAFVLEFTEPPADRIERIGEFLRGKGMSCSVYVAGAYLDGLYRKGFGADANRLIASHERPRSWMNMIATGGGGAMEGWDVSIKGNTTYSHPWAASPVFLLPQGMLGIRPIEPGYRVFSVAPQPDGIPPHSAEAAVPTPYGMIRVSYVAEPERMALNVTVPEMTTARVTPPPEYGSDCVAECDGRAVGIDALTLPAGAYHLTFARRS